MSRYHTGAALITNGDNELGEAIVRALVDAGCRRVVLAGNSIDVLRLVESRVAAGPVQVRLIPYSSNSAEDVEKMMASAVDMFGGIDYCINCCSLTPYAAKATPTAQMDPAEFKAGLDSTSRALWLSCRAQVRHCLSKSPAQVKKTSIVNIIPYGNLGSHPGHAVLAVSGYGGVGMTKSMARDHLSDGLRINVVAPALLNSASGGDELMEHMKIPGRCIELAEVANAAVFLVGEAASSITGIVLPVDAGWSMLHG